MHRTTKLVALFALTLSGYAAGCANDDETLPAGEGGDISGGGTSAAGAAGSKASAGTTGKGGTSATGGSAGTTAKAGNGGSSAGGAATGGTSAGGTSAGGKSTGGAPAGGTGGTTGGSAGNGTSGGGTSAGGTTGGTDNGGSAGSAGDGGGAGGSAGEGGAAGGQGGTTGGSAGDGGATTGGTGGTGGGGNPLMGTPDDAAAILAMFSIPCMDDITTIYDDATPPSPWDSSHRGDVIRCAFDRTVPIAEMQAHYDGSTPALPNPGVYTDVHKFRITYWTERDLQIPPIGSAGAGGATMTPTPVLTSAVFYVPALRVAKPSPLLVYAHPTVGAADICAPSKEDVNGANDDWRSRVYGLIGHGWTVVMPDMPGLGTSGTPAWQDSEDEAHSLLDGMRAVRKITTADAIVNGKNGVLGHSEGGHGVLAAHSYAAAYGMGGTSIDAFIGYAPVSFTQGAWGAILTSLAAGMGLFIPGPLGFATQYFYGHLAKYEGESHRTDMFLASTAAQAQTDMDTVCENTLGDELFKLAPNKKAADIFTSTYVSEVGNCGAFGSCSGMTASWWRARWVADRPPPDTTLPLVIWQGAMDASVSPDRQQCGVDRFVAQGGQVTVCGDPAADHSGIASSIPAATWTEQYLRSKFLGEAPPAACPAMTRADGTAPKCAPPPPNSLSPMDP